MIKFTECLRRLPHLSHQEFLDYWLNTHGPLVKGLAVDLKMGRYVQSHTLVHPVHDAIRKSWGSGEPYDGITEVWYDCREAMERSFATPAMKVANRKLREDEIKFLDLAQGTAFFTEEHVIIE